MIECSIAGRVSTNHQKESGAGEAAQLDACMRHAEKNGWKVVGTFFEDEGVSGGMGLDRRPKLIEAISSLKAGGVLLVAKRDRLARDPLVMAMIEAVCKKKKVRIVSAAGEGTEEDGPADVLMRRIVDAFAEYEKALASVRTKQAHASKRARGRCVGQAPYGWDPNEAGPMNEKGRPLFVRKNPEEQAILERIETWRAEGWSLRKIATELNVLNIPTKRGRSGERWSGRWTHSSVDSIIRSADHWRAHVSQGQETQAQATTASVGQ
ncbi:recombinase family protein [Singulisphaera sp. PoT]|uniref:recombinase family protein n=1 Tax=Singulisphaera sp. PoT TaxID=3411797 RepID=UPI003BF46FC8